MASYTRAYGIRTYVTRQAALRQNERRRQMAKIARPSDGWNPWLWCWVGSEDVASAHRLLMEADNMPPHDIFFLNSDDTTALETTHELVEKSQTRSDADIRGRLHKRSSILSQ